MLQVCSRCVLAVGIGLLFGGVLALCAKDCHLWSILALGIGVGACMVCGEGFSNPEESDNHSLPGH